MDDDLPPSFMERHPRPGKTVEDRAVRAETLCFDLVMLMTSNIRLLASILVLLRRENSSFVADLERDLAIMRERLDGMIDQLGKDIGDG
jgi:hypothetical protein